MKNQVNKISSLSLFTNDYNNSKPTFAIHFEGDKKNCFKVPMKEIEVLSAATLKNTHPTGQAVSAPALSRRAANVKALLNAEAEIVTCYTGRRDVEGSSIVVDVIRTKDQAVAVIVFGDVENTRHSKTITVAFTEVQGVRSGSQFRAAVWGKKEATKGTIVKNMIQSEDHAETNDIIAAGEDLYRKGNRAELIRIAAHFIKLADSLTDKAAEKELEALRMLEEGPKPSAFDLEVEAYAEAIQNEAEATETEVATVAPVQVAEAVPATVEATSDEDEFDFLNDEEDRKVKLKAFATRNRLRGVREELATETEAKRRADEEERSIMAYQLNEHYHVVDSGLMHAVIH
ncbi:MAG: hypothetical protein ACRC2Y_04395 [Aeromonas veronii]